MFLTLSVSAGSSAALLALYRGLRALRRARLIEDTAGSSVRSAAQGYAELHGRAEMMPGDAVVSPLTGMRCAWYRYRVDRLGLGSLGLHARPPWISVHAGRSDALFALRDATGLCVVDPDGATVMATERDVWYGNSAFPEVGPKAGPSGWLGAAFNRFRYTEERISHGSRLYAIGQYGTVRDANDRQEIARDVAYLLCQWKRDQPGLLHRFDRNRDGRIGPAEWEQARAAARRVVLEHRTDQPADAIVHLLHDPADRRLPYILSTLSPRCLVTQLRRRGRVWLGMFFLLGSATAWLSSSGLGG